MVACPRGIAPEYPARRHPRARLALSSLAHRVRSVLTFATYLRYRLTGRALAWLDWQNSASLMAAGRTT